LREAFPPIVTERWSEKTGKQLKDSVETFNPASRQQIARRLEGLGVKWTKMTDKGSIIVDETTLGKHVHIPEAAAVLDYLTTNKKQSQVNSWLKHVTPEGRVHGRVDTLGAVTGRMTHQQPNMAQIAKGEDTRGVWIVDKGMKLVGIDASGLELRMLAHYMQDAEYTEAVESGDVHALNRDALGLSGSEGRDVAKTFIYAFLYGAGDAKIGSIMGGGAKQGKQLKEDFLSNTPALAKLREKVARIAKKGYLPALDGRPLRVRSEHAALNVLLQGAGAIVMKRALLIGDELLTGTPYKLVAQVHDELQCEVSDEHSHRVGHQFVEGIRAAGLHYDMRIKLDGEYSVGNSWHDTH
jgi:DNA polymerase I-like protein with 3'-5' exonuclease and polymerase domains